MSTPTQAPPIAAPDPNLAEGAVRGLFWIGGGQAIRQVIRALTSVALSRILLPADFGLMGMAVAFFNIAGLISDFGIGSAVIQTDREERAVLSSAFWTNLGVASFLAVLLTVFSPAVASFYHEPQVAPILIALSFSMVITALMIVPRGLLYKRLDFQRIVRAELVGAVVGSLAAIGFALAGFGVWSLVLQPLVGTGVTVAMTWWGSRWLPSFEYTWSGVAPLVGFSVWVLGMHLISYANKNFDQMLLGRQWGDEQLGYYSMATQLMLFPMMQVSVVVSRVLFPTLAQVKNDADKLRAGYLKSVAGISLVTFPMLLGLYAVAQDFVPVVFGPKWLPMTPVLEVFCFAGLVLTVGTTGGTIFMSLGRTKEGFLMALAAFPITILAYWVGLRWGPVGVASAYIVAHVIGYLMMNTRAFGFVGLKWSDFFRRILPPAFAAGAMAVVVRFAVRPAMLAADVPTTARLLISIAIGIAIYTGLAWLVNRTLLTETWSLIRRSLAPDSANGVRKA